jgi:hypothetical protein
MRTVRIGAPSSDLATQVTDFLEAAGVPARRVDAIFPTRFRAAGLAASSGNPPTTFAVTEVVVLFHEQDE